MIREIAVPTVRFELRDDAWRPDPDGEVEQWRFDDSGRRLTSALMAPSPGGGRNRRDSSAWSVCRVGHRVGRFASRRTRVANRSIDASALTTSALLTSNGIAWMVSPGTVAASATVVSASTSSARSPTSVSVVGSPTRVVNSMKSRISPRRRALEHQLGDRADVHLLPVREPVGGGDRGEPVVDGVRRGQPARLEPEAGQQRVRLDHLLHSRGHLVVAHGVDRL